MNAQFNSVRKRILNLGSCYLSSDVNPLGEYSQEQQDNARAYVLLSHAEIESFLEELSLQAGEAAVSYIKLGKYNDLTMRYISFSGRVEAVAKQNTNLLMVLQEPYLLFRRMTWRKTTELKRIISRRYFVTFCLTRK